MKAEAVYVVVTPKGYVSEGVALSELDAIRLYLANWLPADVRPTGETMYALWQSFQNVGYSTKKLELPPELFGAEVCRT